MGRAATPEEHWERVAHRLANELRKCPGCKRSDAMREYLDMCAGFAPGRKKAGAEATCPVCKSDVALKKDGTLKRHPHHSLGVPPCRASGHPPIADQIPPAEYRPTLLHDTPQPLAGHNPDTCDTVGGCIGYPHCHAAPDPRHGQVDPDLQAAVDGLADRLRVAVLNSARRPEEMVDEMLRGECP